MKNFQNWENRWENVVEAGKVYKVDNPEPIYIQINGIEIEDAVEIVKLSTTRSAIPEPLRVAHIIAAGIIKGESKGSA